MPVEAPVKKRERFSNPQEKSKSKANSMNLIDKIPVDLVLFMASPYIAGERPQEAIAIAHKLWNKYQYTSTLDILGEDMTCDDDCDASVKNYMELADQIAANPLPVPTGEQRKQLTISLKPSMFSTLSPGQEGCKPALALAFNRIERICAYAMERNINVTLEAEDYRWTDFQLDTYFELLKKGYSNLGTVLQTRLFRTEKDLERFDVDLKGKRVRLVIGIYNESPDIAQTDKNVMKGLMVKYAGILLSKGVYVEFATHDETCISALVQNVIEPGMVPSDKFETQFLHGVPRDQLQETLTDGTFARSHSILVRKYLPFGPGKVAGAYCRRRLKENPNMIGYGIKNLFKLQ